MVRVIHLRSLYESKTEFTEFTSQQSFPQSYKSIEQYSELSLSHGTIHMFSLWAQAEVSLRPKHLLSGNIHLTTQSPSLLTQEKLSYAITDPISMHTHMHTYILDQEKLQCLINIKMLQSFL